MHYSIEIPAPWPPDPPEVNFFVHLQTFASKIFFH